MTLQTEYPGETDFDRACGAEAERLAREFLTTPPRFAAMPIEYGSVRTNALGMIVAQLARDKMFIGEVISAIITFAIIECEDAEDRAAPHPNHRGM